EEQRSQRPGPPPRVFQRGGVERGCIAGRMQLEFHHGLLDAPPNRFITPHNAHHSSFTRQAVFFVRRRRVTRLASGALPRCARNCVMNPCSSRASTASGANASATASAVWYPSDLDATARV